MVQYSRDQRTSVLLPVPTRRSVQTVAGLKAVVGVHMEGKMAKGLVCQEPAVAHLERESVRR